jgi:hypothetical protein
MAALDPRALAAKILVWNQAGLNSFTITMRTADVDRSVMRAAMKIVRKELLPALVEAEVDEGFRRRGRYLNGRELSELEAASEARQRGRSEGSLESFIETLLETLRTVVADHPGADAAELERCFRRRLVRRATH